MEENKHKSESEGRLSELERYECILDYYLDNKKFRAIEGIPRLSERLAQADNFFYLDEIVSNAKDTLKNLNLTGNSKEITKRIAEKINIYESNFYGLMNKLNELNKLRSIHLKC